MTPNYPSPSFSTQFKAALKIVACVIVDPNATKRTWVDKKLKIFVLKKPI